MSETSYEAFPLHWPPGRPRTARRVRAPFHKNIKTGECWSNGEAKTRRTELTIEQSASEINRELRLFGATGIVISSNLAIRRDGLPYSTQRSLIEDPGIAVYFKLDGKPHCVSCDKWDRAADNMAAIAKGVNATRSQLRYGYADAAMMFSGFKQLPGAIVTPQAMTVDEAMRHVGAMAHVPNSVTTPETFKSAYRAAAMEHHPDRKNGIETDQWHLLQAAAAVLKSHWGIA